MITKTPRSRGFILPGKVLLSLILGMSLLTLFTGYYFAKHTQKVILYERLSPMQNMGDDLQSRVDTLDKLYEKHLREVIRTTRSIPIDSMIAPEICRTVVGIRQWSLLHDDDSTADVHIPVRRNTSFKIVRPTLQLSDNSIPGEEWLIAIPNADEPSGENYGWIEDLGKPVLFWQRVSNKSVVVLEIDSREVAAAIEQDLQTEVKDIFDQVNVSNGLVVSLNTLDQRLTSGVISNRIPDLILSVHSHFVRCRLSAWCPEEIQTVFDETTMVSSELLAALLMILGFLTYQLQHQLWKQATQQITFVNRVSHELKSPLTNILLNLDLTQDLMDKKESASIQRLTLVHEEVLRLVRLVDNVLMFSALDRGHPRLSIRYCIPQEVIEGVVSQFTPSLNRKGFKIIYRRKEAEGCYCDRDSIAQILYNLISNVEKYANGGIIEIDSKRDLKMLMISVSDEGPGIPMSEADRIFRPFERLSQSIHEGATGIGLGLSIARDLALSMNGVLVLCSPQKGARFELRIPILNSYENLDS